MEDVLEARASDILRRWLLALSLELILSAPTSPFDVLLSMALRRLRSKLPRESVKREDDAERGGVSEPFTA